MGELGVSSRLIHNSMVCAPTDYIFFSATASDDDDDDSIIINAFRNCLDLGHIFAVVHDGTSVVLDI